MQLQQLNWFGLSKAASELLLPIMGVAGFHNLKILDQIRAGTVSMPFSMYNNFDKALLPFVLLMVLFPGQHTGHPTWQWLLPVAAVPLLTLVAVFLRGLKPDGNAPERLFQFIFANIFFVSLTEETLFRGYLQQRLSGFMPPVLALYISALIFGAMHQAGGMMLIVFATLAGVISGLDVERTSLGSGIFSCQTQYCSPAFLYLPCGSTWVTIQKIIPPRVRSVVLSHRETRI
ncbi:CPBP family intramembrane glutamic endopeptidase [Pantoea sp. App145]|uniref:CPBP family intramembrane glutamic endopeptidase n=1 Tax=Pantoea sp. App145 TaxID=3071567 RepID=UPI003A80F1AB